MNVPISGERQAFSSWLRTGRRLLASAAVEVKFNPWHDPGNGRFTYGPGSWTGGGFTGGGGGSSGGAGASNSGKYLLGTPTGATPRKVPPTVAATLVRPPRQVARTSAVAASRQIERNGYVYTLDPGDRTKLVTGSLTTNRAQSRSRTAQAQAGGADRRPSDDGDHYIARRFNGPTDAFNHFAQDTSFNRGSYRALEDRWAQSLKKGERVSVTIAPTYTGSSRRPDSIKVMYQIGKIKRLEDFPNERPKNTSHKPRTSKANP